MKIVVQGKLIDTDNIYCIHEIYVDHNGFSFNIESFNDKYLEVSIAMYDENNKSIEFEKLRNNINIEDRTEDDKKHMNSLRLEIPIENKNRLEKLRQDVLNIWSNNQSNVPSFNTKNY